MPHSKAYKKIVAAEKRLTAAPKIASRSTGRPASLGITLEQRDRIYQAARAAGYNVQLGPRSQLAAFIDHMIDLAEVDNIRQAAIHAAVDIPGPADLDQRISLTPRGEAVAGF